MKELGEIDMAAMAFVAAIDTELLVPRDVAPESAARSLRVWRASQDAARDWRPSPYPGPVDVFGLAGALRELLG